MKLLQSHQSIGVDSSLFIYLFEEHPVFHHLAAMTIDSIERGKTSAFTSTITLTEILVHPMQMNHWEVVKLYEQALMHLPNLSVISMDLSIAKTAALLRATHRILLGDAVQIATGIHSGATLFLTNDKQLKRVKEITIGYLSDYIDHKKQK